MKNFIVLILSLLCLYSCTSDNEKEYDKALWTYKTKMLKVQFIKECQDVSSRIELRQLEFEMDSIKQTF